MVKLIEISDRKAWLEYRGRGCGTSEMATMLNLNPWQPAISLWHNKIGFNPKDDFVNFGMLGGLFFENFITNQFKSYNGDDETHARNFHNEKYFRECEALPKHSFVVNDLYPSIFSSPDRICTVNGVKGYVELKNTSSYAVDIYNDKIPIPHKIQLRSQLMVGEMPYGYLAFYIDAKKYFEERFERDGIIWHDEYTGETITEEDLAIRAQGFWDSVVLARQKSNAMRQAKLDFNMILAEQLQSEIDNLAPDPDYSLSYERYMKDNYYVIARPVIERNGTSEDLAIAEQYLAAKEDADRYKEKFQGMKNKVLSLCRSGEKIILPGNGSCIEVKSTKIGIKINVKI